MPKSENETPSNESGRYSKTPSPKIRTKKSDAYKMIRCGQRPKKARWIDRRTPTLTAIYAKKGCQMINDLQREYQKKKKKKKMLREIHTNRR